MNIQVTSTVWMGDHQAPWIDVIEFEGGTIAFGEEWTTIVQGVGEEATHTYFKTSNVYKIEQSAEVEA